MIEFKQAKQGEYYTLAGSLTRDDILCVKIIEESPVGGDPLVDVIYTSERIKQIRLSADKTHSRLDKKLDVALIKQILDIEAMLENSSNRAK